MSLLADARRKAQRQEVLQDGTAAAGLRAAFRMAPPARRARRVGWLVLAAVAVVGIGAGAFWLLPWGEESATEDAPTEQAGVADDAGAEPEAETRPSPPIVIQSPAEPGSLLVKLFSNERPPPVIRREAEEPSAGEEEAAPGREEEAPHGAGGDDAAVGPLTRGLGQGEGSLQPQIPELEERHVQPEAGGIDTEVADAAPGRDSGTFRRERSDGDPEARARTLVEQGDTHRRAGDSRAAMDSYRRALELNPGQREARIGYADLLEQAGRTRRARQVLGEGLAETPGDAPMARRYAALADQAGDLEAAIEALEPARNADDPGRVEAHLAALYRGTGQYEQAANVYTALIEAGDEPSLWRAGLALSLEGQGDAAGARRAWRAVVEDPSAAEPVARHARQRLQVLGDGEQPEVQE